jgi:hypothetical protein
MSLTDLVRLCPPPADPCDNDAPGREDEVARKYGVRFPGDYLEFCRAYGTGGFLAANTHEIFITNLYSRHYERQIEDGRFVLDTFFSDASMARELQVQSLSLLALFPLGSDTDESYLVWVAVGDPVTWKVLVLNYESQNFDVYDLGITAFLAAYFGGRLSVRGWQHRLARGRVLQYSFVPPEVC